MDPQAYSSPVFAPLVVLIAEDLAQLFLFRAADPQSFLVIENTAEIVLALCLAAVSVVSDLIFYDRQDLFAFKESHFNGRFHRISLICQRVKLRAIRYDTDLLSGKVHGMTAVSAIDVTSKAITVVCRAAAELHADSLLPAFFIGPSRIDREIEVPFHDPLDRDRSVLFRDLRAGMESVAVLISDLDVVGVILFPVALIPVQPVRHIRVFLHRSDIAALCVPHQLRGQFHFPSGRQLLIPVEFISALIQKPHLEDHSVYEDVSVISRTLLPALRVDQDRAHFQIYLIRSFIERLHKDRAVLVDHIVPQFAACRSCFEVPVIPFFDDPVRHVVAVDFVAHLVIRSVDLIPVSGLPVVFLRMDRGNQTDLPARLQAVASRLGLKIQEEAASADDQLEGSLIFPGNTVFDPAVHAEPHIHLFLSGAYSPDSPAVSFLRELDRVAGIERIFVRLEPHGRDRILHFLSVGELGISDKAAAVPAKIALIVDEQNIIMEIPEVLPGLLHIEAAPFISHLNAADLQGDPGLNMVDPRRAERFAVQGDKIVLVIECPTVSFRDGLRKAFTLSPLSVPDLRNKRIVHALQVVQIESE